MADNHGLDHEMDVLESSEPPSGTVEGASADPTGPQLNPPASTPRDPEQGTGARYRSSTGQSLASVPEVTDTPMPLWKFVSIVISLLLCFVGCLNYITSIVIEVSCMWPNLNGQSTANSTAPMLNDTCRPEESQEDIPYDLIDLILYLQLIIIVILWKFKYAKHIVEYETKTDKRGIDEIDKEKEFRQRRTYYFISLNLLFFFLFHCVECTNCSFLNPNVFFGTTIKDVGRSYCPWINFAFQLPAVPAYILYSWYATKMACVLRRRAEKIDEKSEEFFGTDGKAKDPRKILKKLNDELFHDTWGEKVWKNISIVMNYMMFFSVILVLLYTHVYISNVKLTLGRWFSHFMRLLSIASLSLIPYLYVAYACVRVTEAFKEMSEKSMEADRNDNEGEIPDSNCNDNSNAVTMSSIEVRCDTPGTLDKIAIRHIQWDRLHQKISKVQDTALYNGILTSAYTTRNGVHWTLLAMIGAVAWEVLDHLNAFEDSIDSDTNKNRFIVALYGTLALVATILAVILVLLWQLCCGDVMCKKVCTAPDCSTNISQKMTVVLVTVTIVIFWAIIYIAFLHGVNQDKLCSMELNPLVS